MQFAVASIECPCDRGAQPAPPGKSAAGEGCGVLREVLSGSR